MIRRNKASQAAMTLAGLVALSSPLPALAQQADTSAGPSRPRSTNERIETEANTPPPANSLYRKAAEGVLPQVPGVGSVPVNNEGPGARTIPGAAIDPAARALVPGLGAAPGGNRAPGASPEVGVVMLIEHALGMGIDAASLGAIAGPAAVAAEPGTPGKMLMDQADAQMQAGKSLLAKAAADGGSIDGNSPVRQMYAAANQYMTSLGAMSAPGKSMDTNDLAKVALVNNAVKATIGANRIRQMVQGIGPGASSDQLMAHAQKMQDGSMNTINQLAGNGSAEPNTPMMLAQNARQLLEAVDKLAPMMAIMPGYGGMPGYGVNGFPQPGPNPGMLQSTQPEIIGGTYATGSPSTGTATAEEAARGGKPGTTIGPNGVLNAPAPEKGVSAYGVGNNLTPPTNSSAGSRPR